MPLVASSDSASAPDSSVQDGRSNDYDYAEADPVNNLDLTGQFCVAGKNKTGRCRGNVRQNWRRFAQGAAFGVCVVATAGACVAAGGALAAASYVANGRKSGYASRRALTGLGKDLAWTAAGGGFGRYVSGSWSRSAIQGARWTRPIGKHTAVTRTYRAVDWRGTGLNLFGNGGAFVLFNGFSSW